MDPFFPGFDPFQGLQQPSMIPAPGTVPAAAGPRVPPYTPEEEESILSRIGGGALKGLSWLGGSLGKAFGGRAIRGLLGGHPDELASILPFSDTLGITDPTREVRGSDLLGGDKDTSLLSPEGVGGFALDVLLDPATYLTFGGSALTGAGQAAKMEGKLLPTLAERMAGGQQGLVGLGLPFRQPSAVLGANQGGLDLLNATGRAMGPVAKFSGLQSLYNNVLEPAGRNLRSLFDPTVHGATSAEGQLAGQAFDQAFKGGSVAASQRQLEAAKILHGAGNLTPEAGNELRRYIELGDQFMGPARPGVEQAAGLVGPDLQRMLQVEQQLGLPAHSLVDEAIDYFPRYKTILDKDTRGFSSRPKELLPTGHPSLANREEILKNIPGGTDTINALLKDQQLKEQLGNKVLPHGTAPNPLGPAETIRGRYLGAQPGDDATRIGLAQKAQAGTATADELDALKELQGRYQQSLGLADWVKSQDPQYAEKGMDFFGNNPLSDYLTRSLHHERAVAGTNATYDLLAKNAQHVGAAEAGAVPLEDVLVKAGLGEGGKATAGAKQQMLQRLGIPPDQFHQMYVPDSIAKDATKFVRAFTTPEGLEPFLKVYDSVTNLTKAGQTSVWPAFHARNAITGLFQNWVTNAADPRYSGPMAYIQPIKDAWAIRSGEKAIEGANAIKGLEHLTPEAATKALAEEMYAHGVTGRGNIFNDVAGQGDNALQQALRLPGEGAKPLGEKLAGASFNPLDVAGVGRSNKTQFAPGVVGQHMGETVDDLNRMSAYIAKRRQGYEPAIAAAETKAAHFDYSALTPFERSVMRRVIPFYNWMSNNIPFSVKQLAEQPGGKYAAAIKMSGESRGKEPGFLPDYLQDTLALPIGGRDETGTQRFLTRTGLPFEDLPGAVSAQSYLGSLNPLLKLPLEMATGTQLDTGRKLSDLYSTTGSPVLDEVLAQSPLSRAMGTVRTAVDERKDLATKLTNMLSGVHLSDVDLNKSRDIAVRDYLQEAIAGNPHFRQSTDFSARPEALAELSPHEIALLRLQATRAAEARQRARIGVKAQ